MVHIAHSTAQRKVHEMKKTSPILLWAALGEALGVNRAQIDKAIAHNEKYRVGATRTTEKLPEKITLADVKPEAHAALIDEALRVHGSVKVAAEKLGVDEEIVEARRRARGMTVARAIQATLKSTDRPMMSKDIMAAVERQFQAVGKSFSYTTFRSVLTALSSGGILKKGRPERPFKGARVYSLA